MLSIKFPSNYGQGTGYNRLLVRYSSGLTRKDKILFSFLKISYLILRFKTDLIFGNKMRKEIFPKKRIAFKDYMANRIGQGKIIKVDVPKYGYSCYCRTVNNLYDMVIMTIHEDDMLQLFQPDKDDVVVDVGAHLGRYTLISSRRVGEKGKVFAIEGEPLYYEMLNKNLKLNKVSNVIAINCVVGSEDKYIKYEDFSGMENDEFRKDHIKNNIMHVNSLDNILINQHGINEVNWIKIDVEGSELEVLKGADNILSNSKRIRLQIEIHGINQLYKPIRELLNSYNFKIIFEKDEPAYRNGNRVGAKQVIADKLLNDEC